MPESAPAIVQGCPGHPEPYHLAMGIVLSAAPTVSTAVMVLIDRDGGLRGLNGLKCDGMRVARAFWGRCG
jgi:hypothetical protein